MIPQTMDELDIESELLRKTVETIDWLSKDEQFDDTQRLIAYQAVNMTTRGLVDSDISFAVDDEIEHLNITQNQTQVLIKGDKTVVLRLEPTNAVVHVYDKEVKSRRAETTSEAIELFKKMELMLLKKGYYKINWG